MTATTKRDYLTCAESAKLIRAALKRHFPNTKFGVRSHNYAGGASVRVTWNDGPSSERVSRVAQRFEGASFDGMTDSKSYHDMVLADEAGNTRSVHMGSDYVFCDRNVSPDLKAAVIATLKAAWLPEDWDAKPDYEHERMAWRAVCVLDIPNGEPVEVSAKRAVDGFFARGDA